MGAARTAAEILELHECRSVLNACKAMRRALGIAYMASRAVALGEHTTARSKSWWGYQRSTSATNNYCRIT